VVAVTTGIFFHEYFIGKRWPIIGDRYRNFKKIIAEISKLKGVEIFSPKPISEDILLKIHSEKHIAYEKKQWYYEGARLTVGGAVEASEKVWKGELKNAIAFLVAAGHHAGRDSAWGGTYLSCIGPILYTLRNLGCRKIAYIDTDCHHGDGARDILEGDNNVLHLCFCSLETQKGTMICMPVYSCMSDGEYLKKVEHSFEFIRKFKPELIVHFLGHDTHEDDYGSLGLSSNFFITLVDKVNAVAKEVGEGKYVILDGGGANPSVGEYIFPKITKILTR
jgi:acetoin utilization deacetylase AcuC-like enzyme